MRELSFLDGVLVEFDAAIKTILPPKKRVSARLVPGQSLKECVLTMAERKHVAGLMRVNHAGEVCAQALYQGQALTARLTHIKEQMTAAANDEIDHLAWCEQRLHELGSSTSKLSPLWYMGSIMLGALAGLAGDRVSLGFVAETENQVAAHLQKHLEKLPAQDEKSRLILEQMRIDESEHAKEAQWAGAMELPSIIKKMMTRVSQVMTFTAYYF